MDGWMDGDHSPGFVLLSHDVSSELPHVHDLILSQRYFLHTIGGNARTSIQRQQQVEQFTEADEKGITDHPCIMVRNRHYKRETLPKHSFIFSETLKLELGQFQVVDGDNNH
jgi:hypothetical protein